MGNSKVRWDFSVQISSVRWRELRGKGNWMVTRREMGWDDSHFHSHNNIFPFLYFFILIFIFSDGGGPHIHQLASRTKTHLLYSTKNDHLLCLFSLVSCWCSDICPHLFMCMYMYTHTYLYICFFFCRIITSDSTAFCLFYVLKHMSCACIRVPLSFLSLNLFSLIWVRFLHMDAQKKEPCISYNSSER